MPSRSDRKYAFAFVERGKALAQEGKRAEAIAALREAVRLDPDLLDAWTALAEAHYAADEDIECLGACDEALKRHPSNGAGWFRRGEALKRMKRYEEALDAYVHAMKAQEPGKDWYWTGGQNTFWLLFFLRRFDEALRCADTILETRSNGWGVWCLRARALIVLERPQEALEAAARALRLGPKEDYVWFTMAFAQYAAKRYDDALASLSRAAELGQNNADMWWLRGMILSKARQFEEAYAANKQAIDRAPDNAYYWLTGGLRLVDLGRYAEALRSMRKAQALADPIAKNLPELITNLGVIYSAVRRHEEALRYYENRLAIAPEGRESAVNMAITLMRLDRDDEAEKWLATAHSLASGYAPYWSAWTWLYTRRGAFDEAMTAHKKAIALDSDDPAVWELFAELLLALEVYPHALETVDVALSMAPYDPDTLEVRARALRGLGRAEEADEIERTVAERLAEQRALVEQLEREEPLLS